MPTSELKPIQELSLTDGTTDGNHLHVPRLQLMGQSGVGSPLSSRLVVVVTASNGPLRGTGDVSIGIAPEAVDKALRPRPLGSWRVVPCWALGANRTVGRAAGLLDVLLGVVLERHDGRSGKEGEGVHARVEEEGEEKPGEEVEGEEIILDLELWGA